MRFKAAVLGSPITHSLSPIIHQKAYEILGCDGEFTRFEVDVDQFDSFMEAHPAETWRGFSLTMPLKEVGLTAATTKSEVVEITNSVNTLISDGTRWHAENTDALGFAFLLGGCEFDSVSILGAGGTARSALFALRATDLPITIFRRDSRRDDALRKIHPGVLIEDWSDVNRAFESDLVINAAPSAASKDYERVATAVPVVIDALYAPWPPPLKENQAGNTYISGKELLVAQGMEQVALYTSTDFDRASMFKELLATLNPQI